MDALRLDNLKQYSDVLRSRQGDAVTVRFVEPRDGESCRTTSVRSRSAPATTVSSVR